MPFNDAAATVLGMKPGITQNCLVDFPRPEFAELWERRDIEEAGQIRKEMNHPVLGLLCFESSVMRLPARPDLSIVLHTPLEEADTAGKLEWLASPEGRRAAMYPVAG